MAGLVYTARFENVSIAAIQDILSVIAGASRGAILHMIELSAAASSSTPAEFRLNLKRLPATVTAGSGGTALTINPSMGRNTITASSTVRANDTTQATTSGTALNLQAWQWNVILPFQYLPAPEDRDECQASSALVLEVVAAPTSIAVSGYVKFEEGP